MQNFSKGMIPVEVGALYRRGGGVTSEIAEVVDVGKDRMGIPHVRYNMHVMRSGYAASGAEQRTLSLDSFYARYRERIQRA